VASKEIVCYQTKLDLMNQYKWIESLVEEDSPSSYMLDENTVFKRCYLMVHKMLHVGNMICQKSRASRQGMFTSLGLNGRLRHGDRGTMVEWNYNNLGDNSYSYEYRDSEKGYGYHEFKRDDWSDEFNSVFCKDDSVGGEIKPPEGLWYDKSDYSSILVESQGSSGLFFPRFARSGTAEGVLSFGKFKVCPRPKSMLNWVVAKDIT